MRKSLILGRLLLTTMVQAGGAPLADRCGSRTSDGRWFDGYAILLTPWRRDRYDASLPQRAFVIGWQTRSAPSGPPPTPGPGEGIAASPDST